MKRSQLDALWHEAEEQSRKEGVVYTRYHFAALVAAAERNSWPAEMEAMERQVNILTDALAQAKAEEREACAKVCESMRPSEREFDQRFYTACTLNANAIRARGQNEQ